MERKLTTIFCADVVGYSKMMGQDEEGTLHSLDACRAIIDPLVVQFGGRIFGSAGDSVLAEFASTVNAVKFAINTQNLLRIRNLEHPNKPPMVFRFGLHLGDVVIHGTNLLGDGVNIGARIESMSDIGGVTMSDVVYNQVNNRIPNTTFIDRGLQTFKNIEYPIRLYSVLIEGATVNPGIKLAAEQAARPASSQVQGAGQSAGQGAPQAPNEAVMTLKTILDDRSLNELPFLRGKALIESGDKIRGIKILLIRTVKKEGSAADELMSLATKKLIPKELLKFSAEAINYYTRFALGDKVFKIGLAFKNGNFGEDFAFKFYDIWKIAAKDFDEAKIELAKYVFENITEPEDINDSIKNLEALVRKRNTQAAILLATFYMKANTRESDQKAFEWLWCAKEWKEASAMGYLQTLTKRVSKPEFASYKISAESIIDQIAFELRNTY